MVAYRRDRTPGATYFFTVTLRDRRSDLLTRQVDVLRRAVAVARGCLPFEIVAMVVLPEHLHAVWRLPEGDADYAARWRLLKAGFVRGLDKAGHAVARNRRGEADVWQRRFWEHRIRDAQDLARHVDYIHFNPVKHGHVQATADWPHSSSHAFVRNGWLAADWGADPELVRPGRFGE